MIAAMVGLVIGFLMCIPVGPINVLVINTQINKSSSRALAIAFGGSLMDLVYFLIVLSGLSFFTFSANVTLYLKLAGIILIFILGLKDFLVKENKKSKKEVKDNAVGIFASFLLGVIIYTSNPALLLTMTGLGAFIKSLDWFEMTKTNIIITSVALSLGSFLWFVVLSRITARFQEKIKNKYLNYFNKTSGVLMMALSIFMSIKLFLK
jgi:threonine/homoserine/homoserine lactone efflux protein